MVESKPDDREEKTFILSSASDLEEYLGSSIVFWRLNDTSLPLTPGNLMLVNLRILNDHDLRIQEAIKKNSKIIQDRQSAWRNKVRAEFPIRLQQWKSFIEDIVESGRPDLSYRYNVRVRVILDLLSAELSSIDIKIEKQIDQLDLMLSSIAEDGDFIWNESTQENFPKEKFAYLYVKL